jgi:host factor-I protein
MMNRKLIRPKLSEVQPRAQQVTTTTREMGDMGSNVTTRRKQIPPEQTNAENFYYIKQMSTQTPMTIIMNDGEELRGVIEWYDKDCIKFNRDRDPNMIIYKRYIKYIYKQRDRR